MCVGGRVKVTLASGKERRLGTRLAPRKLASWEEEKEQEERGDRVREQMPPGSGSVGKVQSHRKGVRVAVRVLGPPGSLVNFTSCADQVPKGEVGVTCSYPGR